MVLLWSILQIRSRFKLLLREKTLSEKIKFCLHRQQQLILQTCYAQRPNENSHMTYITHTLRTRTGHAHMETQLNSWLPNLIFTTHSHLPKNICCLIEKHQTFSLYKNRILTGKQQDPGVKCSLVTQFIFYLNSDVNLNHLIVSHS